MQHYTTIDQSKHLLELGLNPESADMCYGSISYNSPGPYCGVVKVHKPDLEFNDLPCWSLGALLEIIASVKIEDDFFQVMLWKDISGWSIECKTVERNESTNTPIEAVYSMVVWLLTNSYIKKGK